MSTFIWVPDRDYSTPKTARVNEASFGDGYTAREPIGINSISKQVQVAFTGRSAAEIRAIDNFLTSHKGATAFDWYDFMEQLTGKYVCQEWDPRYSHEGNCSLSAKFKRVYET